MRRFIRRPSPAMLVATAAVVLGLGGTGYAATKLPKNSVTSKQVKDRSLLARDFKRGQLPEGEQGPAGANGAPGPQGPAGVAQVTAVDGNTVSMCANGGGGCQVQSSTATCPAGQVVTGGGWNSDSIDISTGYAKRTGTSQFSVIGINYATTTRTLTAQAICAAGPGVTGKRVAKRADVRAELAAARAELAAR